MGPGEEARLRMQRIALDYVKDRAERVERTASAQVPIGDPAEDPNPAIALRASGDVDVAVGLTGYRATITFSTPYAKKQELDQRLKHPRGGKSRYLGDAVKAEIPTFASGLAARLKASNR